MMNSGLLQYEVKHINVNDWKMITEAEALELLQINFFNITPIIAEMLNGKEIKLLKGILRIKNHGKNDRFIE